MSDVDGESAEFAQRFAATLWGDEPSPLRMDNRAGAENRPHQRDSSALLGVPRNNNVRQPSTTPAPAWAWTWAWTWPASLFGALIVLGIRTYRANRRTYLAARDCADARKMALVVIPNTSIEQEGTARV